jgi:type II secretory pathway pseudopilin PulG
MKKSESGFALLLVFAMAATVALLLYMALPRTAFEAQRNREQTLIERGEQYKRAIQLYFRKFKTYPASIEALENTNNIRFLRRRYTDPLTGKDEWRLIHVGPGGIFTDSITNKPKGGDKKDENLNTFITEGPAIGSTGTDQQSSDLPRRRPSEGGQPQPGTDAGGVVVAGVGQPGTDQAPLDPGTGVAPPASGQPIAGQSGPPPPFSQNPGPPTGGAPGVSAFPGVPASPFNPGSTQGGTTGSQDPTGQAGGQQNPATGSPNPLGQPGTDPSQAGSNQAADMLRDLLTRPRAQPGAQAGAAGGNGSIATGSIAGVASKVEKHSIKVYNEREKYNEWEFIYDFKKDRTVTGQLPGQMGASGFPQQQTGQQPTNTSGFGGQSTFGPQSGFGNQQSGFGNQSAGPLPPPTPPPPTTPPQ